MDVNHIKLLPLTDKSLDNIEYMVTELNIEHEAEDRIRNILCKAKNLYQVMNESNLFGFINLKYDSERKITFCSIQLKNYLNSMELEEVVRQARILSQENEMEYLVLLDMFNNYDWSEYSIKYKPWDSFDYMRLNANDIVKQALTHTGIDCKFENLNFEDLLDLHLKSYISEPAYVIGEWQQLLERFFTFSDNYIVSGRLDKELVSVCIGYKNSGENYIYSICVLPEHRGRQVGYQLMHYYLTTIKSDCYNLHVLHSNVNARKLYERIGFKIISKNNLVYKFN